MTLKFARRFGGRKAHYNNRDYLWRRFLTRLIAPLSVVTRQPLPGQFMDNYQLHRRKVFGPFVTREARGLEIGAGYRPTFPKREGFNVTVIDHCGTADLIAKHDGDTCIPKEQVAQIEEVDVVCIAGAFSDMPGLAGSFDYVAACHVIEHAVDVCGFLKDCAALLKPGGHLLLAIPERSCIQDIYRPASTIGDVLLAHVAPHAYDVKSRMDESWYAALLNGGGAWSSVNLRDAAKQGYGPAPAYNLHFAEHTWALTAAGPPKEGPYRDAHRWVFDQPSFAELSGFLEVAAGTQLHLISMPGTFECEFYAVLQKTPVSPGSREELEQVRLASLRERQAPVGS